MTLKNDVTGDHAESIHVVTRRQEKKILLESLPKKAQELLNFQVRRYNGRDTSEAERWLKDIEEWLSINDLCLIGVFDFLLADEASILWKNYKTETTTKEEAKTWFADTFMVKKSISDIILELAEVRQNSDERFAAFEIRVRNLLDNVLSSGLSREEMVTDFLTKRARSSGFREALISRPNIEMNDIRNLAKLYETREQKSIRKENVQVNVLQRQSYADIVQKDRSSHEDNRGQGYNHSSRNELRNSHSDPAVSPIVMESRNQHRYDSGFRRSNSGPIVPGNRSPEDRKEAPTVSMKHVARRLYNKCKGLPAPREEQLRKGQCFCCGGDDHMRAHCPLKNRCLICGKQGHLFRECHLLETSPRYPRRSVMCIHDEIDDSVQNCHDIEEPEEEKNQGDPIAYISSVGLSQ